MLIVDPGGTLEDVLLTMQLSRLDLAGCGGPRVSPSAWSASRTCSEQLVGDIRDESDLPVRRDWS